MAVRPSVLVSRHSSFKPGDGKTWLMCVCSNFVNSQPHRLHCFYNKRSTFIHGEEGEDVTPAFGQQVRGSLDRWRKEHHPKEADATGCRKFTTVYFRLATTNAKSTSTLWTPSPPPMVVSLSWSWVNSPTTTNPGENSPKPFSLPSNLAVTLCSTTSSDI